MNLRNVCRLIIITALSFCGGLKAQTPQFRWASIFQAYPNSGSVNVTDIAVDRSGNVYAVGILYDSADFDPGSGVFNLNGQFDNFICKLDSNGALVWVKTINAAVYENTNRIVVDNSGNVYVTGQFNGTCDFDPGMSTFNITAVGFNDIYVCKLNTNGDFEWAKTAGGKGYDGGRDIALDASNNLYITGTFQDTVDFDPGSSKANLFTKGRSYNEFIWKLDSHGNYVWAKDVGGRGNSVVVSNSIAVDSRGHVYTIGSFQDTVDFDPGPGTANIKSDSLYASVFILKLDSMGGYLWAKPVLGPGYKNIRGVAVDKTGNVYAAGCFSQTIDFAPGKGTHILNSVHPQAYDAFICKLDSNGGCFWAKSFNAGHNINNTASGCNIVIDDSNNVFNTGLFRDSVDFDPSPTGTAFLTTTTSTDYSVYISKLNANGDYVWARSIASRTTDINPAIALDDNGSIFGCGYFYGNVNFDPGPGTTYRSAGQHSGYIFKWSNFNIPNGVPKTIASGFNWVTIAPVPASDDVTIRCTNPDWYQKEAFIYNMQGNLVLRFKMGKINTINISSWIPGMYKLQTPGGDWMKLLKN